MITWFLVRACTMICPVAAALLCAAPAIAQPGPDEPTPAGQETDESLLLSTGALDTKIAVMSFDALGMDSERVARLETLFRKELDRLSKRPLPSWPSIDATIRKSRKLRRCGRSNKCLARIGKALKVNAVVSGNVAGLGDSYILDIKVVSTRTGQEIRRLSTDPLRGNPDELIESMRVAAYRLLAPDELKGSLTVLTDLIGAVVKLDGKEVGKTPLPGPLYKLDLGEHKLEVLATGYVPFKETVAVRFQKSTRVVVRMTTTDAPDPADGAVIPTVTRKRPADTPWYSSKWMYIGVGVTAAIVGGYVGYRLARDPVVDCSQNPGACGAVP